MSKWLMVLGGLVSTVAGIYLIVIFASQVLLLLEGVVGILASLIGAIFLFIGISELKE